MYWKMAWAIKQLLLRDIAEVKGYTRAQKVENPSKDIEHKSPLLVQIPCPTDQLLNHSLNMVNREINGSSLKVKP